jgi:hypothetical protein
MTIFRKIFDFREGLKVELTTLRGTCQRTGESITISCATSEKTRFFLAAFILGSKYETISHGDTWLWNVVRKSEEYSPEAIVVFVEAREKKLDLFFKNGFKIPVWVTGEIALPIPESLRRQKTLKEDMRKVRQSDFGFRISRNLDELKMFYDTMYLPLVEQSHGQSAVLKNRENLLSRLNTSELLLITKGEEAVAGQLISFENEIPKLFAIGVRDGDPSLIRSGALSACYFFCSEYLNSKGFTRLDTGLSRAFINDGVLNYKRKWGLEVRADMPVFLLMHILRDKQEGRNFLAELPLIFKDNDELCCLIFADGEQHPLTDPQDLIKRYRVKGTKRLFAYQMDDTLCRAPLDSAKIRID